MRFVKERVGFWFKKGNAMITNIDILIKNTTIEQFVARFEEMRDELLPMLEDKGYIFEKTAFSKDFINFENKSLNENEKIFVAVCESNGHLYVHDHYSSRFYYNFYNEEMSLFDVLKKVSESFDDVQYYESKTGDNMTTFSLNKRHFEEYGYFLLQKNSIVSMYKSSEKENELDLE